MQYCDTDQAGAFMRRLRLMCRHCSAKDGGGHPKPPTVSYALYNEIRSCQTCQRFVIVESCSCAGVPPSLLHTT